MKLSGNAFRALDNKRITLLGMSGVGKTHLAKMLRGHDWFHYSGDYRIGTRYLDEPILDNIKREVMRVPFLRDLLRSDSIYIANNITVDNLSPVASFLGKLGDPELGGLPLAEFKRRQALHRDAEIDAMLDVPDFVDKAREIYGYRHFVNDAGGSLCELEHPTMLETLAEHSLIIYIRANPDDEAKVIARAVSDPKPMYYREAFLDEQLELYMSETGDEYVAQIEPDAFVRWVFPRLFYSRIPRYEQIAAKYGYTVTSDELGEARDEAGFIEVIANALDRQPTA